MNAVAEIVGERAMNHAMAFQAGFSRKHPRHDANAKVAFAARAGPGMAGVKLAFIRNLEFARRQRLDERPHDSLTERTERLGSLRCAFVSRHFVNPGC